jgi:hypothetical protein
MAYKNQRKNKKHSAEIRHKKVCVKRRTIIKGRGKAHTQSEIELLLKKQGLI